MTRSQRIRVIVGTCVFLLGLAVGCLGPMIAAIVLMPDLRMPDAESLNTQVNELQRLQTVTSIVAFAGLLISGLAGLYTFIEWACWFVGAPDKTSPAENS